MGYEATVPPNVATPLPLFPELPLGNDTQQAFAYHIYCAPGDGHGLAADLMCKAAQDVYWHGYASFLGGHRGLAGFLTEFGAVGGSSQELAHMDRLLGRADELLQSWAYWQLKKYEDFTTQNAAESLYNASGQLELEKLKTL